MFRLPLIAALAALVLVTPASAQPSPPDPAAPHGNLCPRNLTGRFDVPNTYESLGVVNVGTALQLDNGMLVTPQGETSRNAYYTLYLAHGSTVHVRPVSIAGNGYFLSTMPLGDPFEVSCDVTNVNDPLEFDVQTSLLKS